MKSCFLAFLLLFSMGIVFAQTPPPSPDPTAPSVTPPANLGVEENLDASGLVINKNTFSYDGNEGRDPFKIYREYVQQTTIVGGPSGVSTNPFPAGMEKNIRTALVPDDIVVQGIFYKKNDPVALVIVKGAKGLNKLKVNSSVGRNEGKVIEIRKDRIIIEQVKDFDGQKFSEKIELKVREKRN